VPEFESSSLSIDLSRIGIICEEEWRAFLRDMEETPIPQRQDLRGFLLAWVAVFMPEAFPKSLQNEMAVWLSPLLDTSQMTWGHVRLPLIASALFALTGDIGWLQIQIDNFADGGSLVRNFFHKSLALVADRISFTSQLMRGLDLGMKSVYFYMDLPLALYAVSQGDVAEKLVNLKRWQQSFMNSSEKDAVDGYLKGHPVINPLQGWLLQMMTYVAMRIASFPLTQAGATELPLGMEFSAVWERVQRHPLFSSSISLELPPDLQPKHLDSK
jgi:hypothetical protein